LLASLARLIRIFDHGKYRAFNQAFLYDLKKWAAKFLSEGDVKMIAQKILAVKSKIDKKHIGFDLVEVEILAKEYQEDN